MSSEQHDPQLLSQYFLGSLTDAETARLDELSITNEEFFWLLTAAENDLVDSYVRGGLSGETLARFRSHYLSSPKRRDKVLFAETLRDFEFTQARASSPPRRLAAAPRLVPTWALAAAAVLALGVGYLFLANSGLRRQLGEARSEQASLQTRAHSLEKQLEALRASVESSPAGQASMAQSAIESLRIVSLVLGPPKRGAGGVPSISLPPGTDVVALQLQLESDDFPAYKAVLKGANNRILWESGRLPSIRAGGGVAVTIGLPARQLAAEHYSIELSGLTAAGSAELLGAYAFRAVIR